MFSFRRKSPKKDANNGPPIRTSPSLPELHSQGIPWPENLIDRSALPAVPQVPLQGAARTSFPLNEGPIPFHKPFWSSPGKSIDSQTGGSISSWYMSHPPSAFDNRRTSAYSRTRPSQKKARNPTTFNIMVVGSQGTGKTSLLRLLLDTADISPTATADQKVNMERFLRGSPKRTEGIETACVEICESKYDRLLLSVIDTPGLDFQIGHELKLERQVTSIVRYMDTQFADTLSEESKVVRQSKGDQHIHLCIYTIDPSSIMTASARRALSSLPSKTRSETTVHQPREPVRPSEGTDGEDSDDDEEEWTNFSMSAADIRVIRRLTKRANVLPVIARADSLTNYKLDAIKKVIRRDLNAAGIDFGVFGPAKTTSETPKPEKRPKGQTNGNGETSDDVHENGNGHANGHDAQSQSEEGEETEEEPEERRSRTVIKLRALRSWKPRLSRSRSRLELSESANEPSTTEINDTESVASVRFSANIVSKTDLSETLPFALIAPEHVRRRRPIKTPRPISAVSEDHHSVNTEATHSTVSPSEDGHAPSVADSSMTPTSPSMGSVRNFSYLAGPPADLKGVFVRQYRWGTIDVLSPEHCDFAALRTAVLSTHMKMLKVRTKEVLYEKFRTEKLLARRATRNIGEDETRRLLEDLGL